MGVSHQRVPPLPLLCAWRRDSHVSDDSMAGDEQDVPQDAGRPWDTTPTAQEKHVEFLSASWFLSQKLGKRIANDTRTTIIRCPTIVCRRIRYTPRANRGYTDLTTKRRRGTLRTVSYEFTKLWTRAAATIRLRQLR